MAHSALQWSALLCSGPLCSILHCTALVTFFSLRPELDMGQTEATMPWLMVIGIGTFRTPLIKYPL